MSHLAVVVRGEYPPRASTVIYWIPLRISTFDPVIVHDEIVLVPPDCIIKKPMIARKTRVAIIPSALLGEDFFVIKKRIKK